MSEHQVWYVECRSKEQAEDLAIRERLPLWTEQDILDGEPAALRADETADDDAQVSPS